MKFTKGHAPIEPRLTQADIETIWELFFGKKYSINHIARDYGVHSGTIIGAIDSESARRWKIQHPHEVNREHLLAE
jgi:hypothetical protein